MGFCPVGFCPVGFCPVVFCPVGFCPDTVHFSCIRPLREGEIQGISKCEAFEIWSVVLLICARIPDSARAEDFGMQTCWDGPGVNEFVL